MNKETLPSGHIHKQEVLKAIASGALMGAAYAAARFGVTDWAWVPTLTISVSIGASGIKDIRDRERLAKSSKSGALPAPKAE